MDVDKITDWLVSHSHPKMAQAIERCERVGVPLECDYSDQHRGSMPISCHRSMCPVCSEKGSRSHKRKIERIAKRLKWIADKANYVLGYCVFTVPKRLRHYFMSKEMLSELHRLGWQCVRDVLGAEGSATVIHFYGDAWYTIKGLAERLGKPEFIIQGWVEDGRIETWRDEQGRVWVRNPTWLDFHPHVNVLFPKQGDGYVTKEKLVELRRRWRELLEGVLGLPIGEDEENANYHYSKVIGQVMHKIGYVSRSTVGAGRFLKLSEAEKWLLVDELRGWRNVRYHGRLSDRNWKKYLEELKVKIEQKKGIECPVCHAQGCEGHRMKLVRATAGVSVQESDLIQEDDLVGERVRLDKLDENWFVVEGCSILLDEQSFRQLRLAQGKSADEIEEEIRKRLDSYWRNRGAPFTLRYKVLSQEARKWSIRESLNQRSLVNPL